MKYDLKGTEIVEKLERLNLKKYWLASWLDITPVALEYKLKDTSKFKVRELTLIDLVFEQFERMQHDRNRILEKNFV
jgi:hypothetical protein